MHIINSISEAHALLGLPKPKHPLISLIDNDLLQVNPNLLPNPHALNFYKISYRTKFSGKVKYGQGYYDFDEGGLLFASPHQTVGRYESNDNISGYVLLIHPDFFLNTVLTLKIKEYGFFSYDVNEALHLSDKERSTITTVFKEIEAELELPIDDFSQDIIIAQIELLFNYCNRYYKRQFITRKNINVTIEQRLVTYLNSYFNSTMPIEKGIPTVQLLANEVNLSASYLGDMLRVLTGKNAQQLIHDKLIEKAKELLSGTNLSVSEIAYQLGFDYSQSFSRLFKSKTELSPLEFRKTFN